ncbi:hypothetical protein ACVWZ6_006052 [Bradyrhizobium sp. GM6.1]
MSAPSASSSTIAARAAARSASAPAISERREIAVGQQAGGDGEEDEGQGQRGLEQAGLAFCHAERQHRDDGGRGQRDLFGRLCRQIGPGEAVECLGEARGN